MTNRLITTVVGRPAPMPGPAKMYGGIAQYSMHGASGNAITFAAILCPMLCPSSFCYQFCTLYLTLTGGASAWLSLPSYFNSNLDQDSSIQQFLSPFCCQSSACRVASVVLMTICCYQDQGSSINGWPGYCRDILIPHHQRAPLLDWQHQKECR